MRRRDRGFIERARKRSRPRWQGIGAHTLVFALFGALCAYFLLLQHNAALSSWLTKSVSAIVLIGLLVGAAVLIRQMILAFLTWWPGPVQVHFSAGSDLSSVTVEQLNAIFQSRMSTLQLCFPDSLPGVGPSESFIDVLATDRGKRDDWLATAIAFVRAAWPTHGYHIEGTAFERTNSSAPCGVSLQLVPLPTEARQFDIIWEKDWEHAMHRAAAAVTAAILPRSRQCKGPWVAWRGCVMPADLLWRYEAATEADTARRYDEALFLYYQALELDPMNLVIRGRIGQLQEKLGLFLDALLTYENMLALREPGGERLPRKLYGRAARRHNDRVILIARYRRLALLGGDDLIHQWVRPDGNGKRGTGTRDKERRILRDALKRSSRPSRQNLSFALSHADDEKEPATRETKIREAFTNAARDEATELQRILQKRRARAQTGLSPVALAMTTIVTDDLRARLRSDTADELSAVITSVDESMRELGELNTFSEHYNAACAWAVLLTGLPEAEIEDKREAITRAIRELELACSRADSAFIANQRDWILNEDPELAALRIEPEFKSFEARYFARQRPTPQRPREEQALAASHYTRDLLANFAKLQERIWHARGDAAASTDVHQMLDWWHQEYAAWRTVEDLSKNYRDWHYRLHLLERIHDLCPGETEKLGDVRFERYEEHPLEETENESVDDAADHELDHVGERIDDLLDLLRNWLKASQISSQHETLTGLDAAGCRFSSVATTEICTREAAVWERLHEWLCDGTNDDDARDQLEGPRDLFAREIVNLSIAWRRAQRVAKAHVFAHHTRQLHGAAPWDRLAHHLSERAHVSRRGSSGG